MFYFASVGFGQRDWHLFVSCSSLMSKAVQRIGMGKSLRGWRENMRFTYLQCALREHQQRKLWKESIFTVPTNLRIFTAEMGEDEFGRQLYFHGNF
jgi:hypothetical protein